MCKSNSWYVSFVCGHHDALFLGKGNVDYIQQSATHASLNAMNTFADKFIAFIDSLLFELFQALSFCNSQSVTHTSEKSLQMAVTKHMTPDGRCIGRSNMFLINKDMDWC